MDVLRRRIRPILALAVAALATGALRADPHFGPGSYRYVEPGSGCYSPCHYWFPRYYFAPANWQALRETWYSHLQWFKPVPAACAVPTEVAVEMPAVPPLPQMPEASKP